MTDQHTPARQLSAAQADAAVTDSVDAPAKPSKARAPKPPVAPPAVKPAARSTRATAKAGLPADTTTALPPNVADAPEASTRKVAAPAAPSTAAAHADAAPADAAEPSHTAAGTEAVRPAHPADSDAVPDLDADITDAAGSDEDALAAAVAEAGDEPGVEVAGIDAGEADAPARDDEDEEEEEEAPRSNTRMPGMGGGMARPGMRPISPQLGGRPTPAPRIPSKAENFVEGDHVVYPTHGVGRVERIATEEIAGHKLELIHITFEENRMTLRVPVAKARSAGLRKLATRKMFDEALAVLRGRARIKRTMWSRRAQEYEAKINSGDPMSIAEVVRDLHRNAGQPDQSFSERQIYEAAMDRLAAELAALDQTEKTVAATKLADYLKTV